MPVGCGSGFLVSARPRARVRAPNCAVLRTLAQRRDRPPVATRVRRYVLEVVELPRTARADLDDDARAPGRWTHIAPEVNVLSTRVGDQRQRFAEYRAMAAPLLKSGELKYREDIVDGLDRAPEAFIGLLQGRNFGKLVVKLGDDPTRR